MLNWKNYEATTSSNSSHLVQFSHFLSVVFHPCRLLSVPINSNLVLTCKQTHQTNIFLQCSCGWILMVILIGFPQSKGSTWLAYSCCLLSLLDGSAQLYHLLLCLVWVFMLAIHILNYWGILLSQKFILWCMYCCLVVLYFIQCSFCMHSCSHVAWNIIFKSDSKRRKMTPFNGVDWPRNSK